MEIPSALIIILQINRENAKHALRIQSPFEMKKKKCMAVRAILPMAHDIRLQRLFV